MIKIIQPWNLSPQDSKWLARACEEVATGLAPVDVLGEAVVGRNQIWRFGAGDGIIITKVCQYPNGQELFIVALAGRKMIADIEAVWSSLAAFAAMQRCDWITGFTKHAGLKMLYERKLGADMDMVLARWSTPTVATVSKGIAGRVRVQTPSGPCALRELEVGDMLLGPDGEQEIVAMESQLVGSTAGGLGLEQQVWRGEDWVNAGEVFPEDPPGPQMVYEVTVEPSHVFLLEDGTEVHNKGGGGGGDTKTVVQDSEPWEGLKPYLEDLYSRADTAFGQSQSASQPSAWQGIWDQREDVAAGLGAGADATRNLALSTIQGDFLDPQSNPFFQDAVNAAIDPLMENFQQRVLPTLEDQAIAAGAYGGSRQGVSQALATNELNEDIADITGQMAYSNYVAERQNQLRAPGMLAQSTDLALRPTDILQQQQLQQMQLPFLPVQQYGQLIGSGPSFGSSESVSTMGGQGSSFGNFASGALGGAATGAMIGSVVPVIGTGIGALAGGVIGGLGSL